MSDSGLRDPLLPRTTDRQFGERNYPAMDAVPARSGNGAMWGFLAVVAILLFVGIFYYATHSVVVLNTAPTATTTGIAPPPDSRPPIPTPQQLPSGPRQAQ